MILVVDVDYKGDKANAAGLVISDWADENAGNRYTIKLDNIKEYIPGQFFKRELPCITKLTGIVKEEISCIVIDGYVWLDDLYKRGLGAFLFQKLNKKIPVIGVAKKSFFSLGQNHREIYRGKSKSALYITSAGIELDIAADNILKMYGKNRIPKLLKDVDRLCREWN